MSINKILVINCGSSSIKFALLEPQQGEITLKGMAERLGTLKAQILWDYADKQSQQELTDGSHQGAVIAIIKLIEELKLDKQLAAIGHRVVHGGELFSASTLINEQVINAIRDCENLAPLHNPANLLGLEFCRQHFPKLPQVAVFDTAFHQTLPEHAYMYALPYSLYREKRVRRYGFHGTSFRYVAQQALTTFNFPEDNHHLLIAHLGNGCSACAISNGTSVDTTMGMTPLEGLVMGTRSGNIDPGLFRFLSDQYGYDIARIDTLLYKESGLLGISEISNDMRSLEKAAAEGHDQAQLAIDIFCYTLAKQLSGLAVALEKIDALIFTGGIGEHSVLIRATVLRHLKLLGFQLDTSANNNNGYNNNGIISSENSSLAAVIATNEELMIARDTAALVIS